MSVSTTAYLIHLLCFALETYIAQAALKLLFLLLCLPSAGVTGVHHHICVVN